MLAVQATVFDLYLYVSVLTWWIILNRIGLCLLDLCLLDYFLLLAYWTSGGTTLMLCEAMTKQAYGQLQIFNIWIYLGEKIWIVVHLQVALPETFTSGFLQQVGSDEHSFSVLYSWFLSDVRCFPLPGTYEAIPEKIWKQSTTPWRHTRHTSDSCTRMQKRTIHNIHSLGSPCSSTLLCRWISRTLYV